MKKATLITFQRLKNKKQSCPIGYTGRKETTMKGKWYKAMFRDLTTNKWREVNILADSMREARYKALTYHKGMFETLESIREKD